MGIIMGALGGLGEAAGQVGSALMKSELDKDRETQLATLRSGLDTQRETTLAGVRSNLETQSKMELARFQETMKNAPLTRLGVKAQELAGEEVPQEAAPVTNLSGAGVISTDGKAPESSGFHGDPVKLRQLIQSWPDGSPEKAAALAQLDSQYGADKAQAEGIVAGATRKRSPDEALKAASDYAKVNDPVAFAQYEKEIGKPMRDDRRIDITAQREDNRSSLAYTAEQRRADTESRRAEVEFRKLDLQGATLESRDRKIDAWIDNEAAKRDRDAEKDANPKGASAERMGSIVNAMNNTIKNLDDNKPRKGEADYDAKAAAWTQAREDAAAVRARAMSKLNSNFDDVGTPAAPAKSSVMPSLPPGSKQIGTSGGKPVYQTPDGKKFIAQ